MSTVTIDATDYTVYRDVSEVTVYLNASLSGAAIWDTAGDTPDKQERAIVEATRIFNRKRWQGSKTSPSQELAWPRSGLLDPDGVAVPEDEIPDAILDGFCELVLLVVQGQTGAAGATGAAEGVRSLAVAGEFTVEFNGKPTAGSAAVFVDSVQELVGFYLATGESAISSLGGAYYPSANDDAASSFDDTDRGRLKHGL